MSTGDDSNGPLSSTDVAPEGVAPSLKLLEASVALVRCRDLLAEERSHEARVEMNRAHALLDELDGQPLGDEHTREVITLLQLAVRLDARLRLFDMRQMQAGGG